MRPRRRRACHRRSAELACCADWRRGRAEPGVCAADPPRPGWTRSSETDSQEARDRPPAAPLLVSLRWWCWCGLRSGGGWSVGRWLSRRAAAGFLLSSASDRRRVSWSLVAGVEGAGSSSACRRARSRSAGSEWRSQAACGFVRARPATALRNHRHAGHQSTECAAVGVPRTNSHTAETNERRAGREGGKEAEIDV